MIQVGTVGTDGTVGTVQSVQSVQCCDASFILDDIISYGILDGKTVQQDKYLVVILHQLDNHPEVMRIVLDRDHLGLIVIFMTETEKRRRSLRARMRKPA